MLVTFSCNNYGNITLFGEVAKRLLTMMGHSVTIPGAIKAEDLPEALAQLQHNLDREKHQSISSAQTDDNELEVSLAHRAFPLLTMLKAAIKNKSNVMWS